LKMTNDEYKKYAGRHAPRSPFWPDVFRAFLVGGLICCLGQLLDGLYLGAGLMKDDAGALVSMSLVFLSALLTGLGVYDDIARFAGAGTLVPITGFANAVVSPALEFKTEGFVLGTAAKMFVIAGPVIVFGISASVVYGLLLVLTGAA
jgi:stage V sporulation protein AC